MLTIGINLAITGTITVAPAGGGGGGGYTAKAVHFDGSTWLARATALTGVADSGLLSFSGWALSNTNPTNPANYFFDIDPPSGEFGPNIQHTTNKLGQVYNPSGANLTSSSADNTWPVDTNWHHVFGYVNTDMPAGSKIIKLYLDGVDVTGTVNESGITDAFTLPFSTVGWAIPDSSDDYNPPLFIGDYADWWIAPGVLETDITKFRDATTHKPKDPATFPTSGILFSGDHTTFATNQGTGGAFTLTGTLTDASTSPSD